jgi:hypothetical protein
MQKNTNAAAEVKPHIASNNLYPGDCQRYLYYLRFVRSANTPNIAAPIIPAAIIVNPIIPASLYHVGIVSN